MKRVALVGLGMAVTPHARSLLDLKQLLLFLMVPMIMRLARGERAVVAVDVIIATFCIRYGHALLHGDRDFEPMTEHLGLRTL